MLVSCLKSQKNSKTAETNKQKTQQKNKRTQEFPSPGTLSDPGFRNTNKIKGKESMSNQKGRERGWLASHGFDASDSYEV